MNAAAIAFLFIALAIGGLIGWLIGSRATAASKQVIESLRLQLDEVVKERDSNRTAAHDLAALRAAQDERDRAHQMQLEALETRFADVSNKLLAQAQETFLKR